MKVQTRREFLKTMFFGSAAIATGITLSKISPSTTPEKPAFRPYDPYANYEAEFLRLTSDIATAVICPLLGVYYLRIFKYASVIGNIHDYKRFRMCMRKDKNFSTVVSKCAKWVIR